MLTSKKFVRMISETKHSINAETVGLHHLVIRYFEGNHILWLKSLSAVTV